MKVRIKRNELAGPFPVDVWVDVVRKYLPDELVLELDDSQVVNEKSNCEKWEEIFMKIGDMDTIEMVESWSKDKADLFDLNGIDATQAYEKIVEGK